MASPTTPNLGASLYHRDLRILNKSQTKQEQNNVVGAEGSGEEDRSNE